MKRGKYQTSPKGVSSKAVALVLSLVLTIGCVVGGTIAWLTDKTDPVENTFTAGDIDITLAETTTNYKMVPGNTIAKDPKVTVVGGSEACWLFVKIEESENLASYISYTVDSAWKAVPGQAGVYYMEVAASDADQIFPVLTNNQVTVKTEVTKAMLEGIQDNTIEEPTLTFTAYAVQKDNINDVATAWAEATK